MPFGAVFSEGRFREKRTLQLMYTLIDRANGETLSNVAQDDFEILRDHLVRESSQDFDFYINEPTIDMLRESGLSQALCQSLTERTNGRGLDLGWEPSRDTFEAIHSGLVVDDQDKPLGGIRVDLLEGCEIEEGELDEDDDGLIDWTYSRPDGRFALGPSIDRPGTVLRFSGRGDLVLEMQEIESTGDKGKITIQTVTGKVHTEDGMPLPGVSVQLLNWTVADEAIDLNEASLGGSLSWGDTDEEGRFAIPLRLPLESHRVEIQLELLAESGESLLEKTLEVDPSETLNLDTILSPTPQDNWGQEQPTEISIGHNEAFEHPLG